MESASLRGYYSVARIGKLNSGSEDVSRSADVKTNTGYRACRVLRLQFESFLDLPMLKAFDNM